MSLDLTLLPFEGVEGAEYSHTSLKCVSNTYDLYDVLEMECKTKLRSIEYVDRIVSERKQRGVVPKRFACSKARVPDGSYEGEECFGEVTTDAYDKPLTFLTVEILLKYKNHDGVKRHARHRAVWAYLEQLPLDLKVALYWH